MRLCRVQRASGLVEELEVRLLPAVVVPTVAETYLVELINRARANPAAEAMRLGLALGEGEGRVALPPLAINGLLEDAAVNHANWMLLNQTTSHVETPNSPLFTGAEVVARMADAGYTDANRAGESLLVQGVRGDLTNFPDYAQIAYQAFFRDAGGIGEPDRQTMLDATVREIGVGIRSGSFEGTSAFVLNNQVAATVVYAAREEDTFFLTGVVYDDTGTPDHFYTPGEGLGNITIQARRQRDGQVFSTAAWGSGAYSLALPPDVYDVTATGPGLGGTFVANHLTIGNANVKLDITPAEVNQPRLTLLANGESISNGAFSPSAAAGTSFGLVALGAASPTQHFTVRNDGVRALDLSSLTLPAGFTAAGLEGVSVSPGQSFSFDIAMETSTPGAHGGSVVVASNDPSASAFQFNVAGFVGTTFLPRLYADLLGRSPDAAGLAAWSDALSTGTTGEAVASAFMQSEEYRTRQVQQAYQAILGRPADAGGQAYWRGFLAGNGTLEQMKAGLFGSAEFAAAHGNSDAEVVEGYYEGMFGRSGDNPGIAYWSSLLAAGYRRDQVAHTLLKSQESRNRTVERLYETYLHRPADAAGLGVWSAQLLPTGASETMVLAALLGSAEYIGS